MPPLSLLIKPASGNCNLNCKYCFYIDVADKREVKSYGMMATDTLEVIVKKAIEKAEGTLTIAFQGGEPTLVGMDFYESLIEFEKKYKKPNLIINYGIQTNGILIDDKWAQFFAKNSFLVGLSLDGYDYIHNKLRTNVKGEGTFDRVIQAARLFDKYKVPYNILTVVTANIAKKINQVYKFYKSEGFSHMQFIPCLDPLYEKRGTHDYSLTPSLYGKFLKDLFDLWYKDIKRDEYVYIRYFENLLQMILGYYPEACGMLGRCSNQYVIESDGSVYPCDFYVLDEYRIGNLTKDSFEQIDERFKATSFIQESLDKDPNCKKCQWYTLCYGGCKRDRELAGKDQSLNNYFCNSYQDFFEYTFPRFKELAQILSVRI